MHTCGPVITLTVIVDPTSTGDNPPLKEAGHRIRACFTEPEFAPNVVDIQLNASRDLKESYRALEGATYIESMHFLTNPNHPLSNSFRRGDCDAVCKAAEVGNTNITEMLHGFLNKKFLPNSIVIVASGRDDLNTLQEWVEEAFSSVGSSRLGTLRKWVVGTFSSVCSFRLDTPTFQDDAFGTQAYVRVTGPTQLRFLFPFPYQERWESKPSAYLEYLFNDTSLDSWRQALIDEDLATDVRATAYFPPTNQSMFVITVWAIGDTQKITVGLFQYLHEISEPQQYIFDQLRCERDIHFSSYEWGAEAATSQQLSIQMLKRHGNDILQAPFIVKEFDPEGIRTAISYLVPEKCITVLLAPEYQGEGPLSEWKRERGWYTSEWYTRRMPGEWLKRMKTAYTTGEGPLKGLHPPRKNSVIFEVLKVAKTETTPPTAPPTTRSTQPTLLRRDRPMLWHKLYSAGNKLCVTIYLRTPSVSNMSAARVFCQQVYLDVKPEASDYENAGLTYSIDESGSGLKLAFRGHREVLPRLLNAVVGGLTKPIDPHIFEKAKIKVRQRVRVQLPLVLKAENHFQEMISDITLSNKQTEQAIQDVTPDHVHEFRSKLFQNYSIEMLVHGGVSEKEAADLAAAVNGLLRPPLCQPFEWHPRTTYHLPPGTKLLMERTLGEGESRICAVDHAMYAGCANDRVLRARCILLHRLLKDYIQSTLRNKEGYEEVYLRGPRYYQWVGIGIHAESSSNDCRLMQARIDKSLMDWSEDFDLMTEDMFDKIKRSCSTDLCQPPQTLEMEHDEFVSWIDIKGYDFNRSMCEAVSKQVKIPLT